VTPAQAPCDLQSPGETTTFAQARPLPPLAAFLDPLRTGARLPGGDEQLARGLAGRREIAEVSDLATEQEGCRWLVGGMGWMLIVAATDSGRLHRGLYWPTWLPGPVRSPPDMG
jgi:hypothetical protein